MTDYNPTECERLIREVKERQSADLTRRGGAWLASARSWIKWNCRNGDRVTWGSDDVLQHEFTVSDVESIARDVAKAAYAESSAMSDQLAAAKAEVERLHAFESRHGLRLEDIEAPGMSWTHDDAVTAVRAARDRLAAEVETLKSGYERRVTHLCEGLDKEKVELTTELDRLRAENDALRAARNEACDLAHRGADRLLWPDIKNRIVELRKVGSK